MGCFLVLRTLGLRLDPAGTLRVEVTDARGDRVPRIEDPEERREAESGRGLRLVAAYADRWGVAPAPAGCRTVWAEVTPGRADRDPVGADAKDKNSGEETTTRPHRPRSSLARVNIPNSSGAQAASW